MNPPGNPIAKKIAHPANSMYGRANILITEPKVNTEKVLDRQLKKKDVFIPSMQKSVGIEHNPYALSRGCKSINDLKHVKMGNMAQYNKQLLNARPKGPMDTPGLAYSRMGMLGANFDQTNQFKHITTWSV